ncbi:alpha/beta hydrolase [Thermodesulfobacteriota bacterium]
MKILVFIVILLVPILFLYFSQHRLIYYPRSYASTVDLPGIERLLFTTGQGKQTAFYRAPADEQGAAPERIWMLFGGNASLALDWYDFVRHYPDRRAAFLLIEYPGYGNSAGRASARTILEATIAAAETLAEHLGMEQAAMEKRLSLAGHSLGAAAALQYSVTIPVQRVVLISPFTSLRDMAALVVGKPLNRLVRDRYDNRARLKELAAKNPRVSVTIFHGDQDEVIPVKMGRELAAMIDGKQNYYEIAGCDHNRILSIAEEQIHRSMASGW